MTETNMDDFTWALQAAYEPGAVPELICVDCGDVITTGEDRDCGVCGDEMCHRCFRRDYGLCRECRMEASKDSHVERLRAAGAATELRAANEAQRLCLDAVQMICQGEAIENLSEAARQSVTVQAVHAKFSEQAGEVERLRAVVRGIRAKTLGYRIFPAETSWNFDRVTWHKLDDAETEKLVYGRDFTGEGSV